MGTPARVTSGAIKGLVALTDDEFEVTIDTGEKERKTLRFRIAGDEPASRDIQDEVFLVAYQKE